MVAVGGLDVLEVDVGVLGGAAGLGVLGVHAAGAEFSDGVPGNELADVVVVDDFDLLNFVRSSETVKEMKERNSAFNSRKVSNSGKVHTFLRIV